MATNHTTNYALNLWEPTDKFVREEFNENTSKIDAAIASRLGSLEIIREVIPTSRQGVSVDLTDISWNEWSVVGAVLLSNDDSTEGHYMVAYVVGCSLRGAVKNFAYRTPGPQMALLFPRRSAENKVCGLFFPGGDIGWCDEDYTTVTGIVFTSNYENAISGNARLVLFGIR